MVNAIRRAELMIGSVDYEMTEKKKKSREFSRSLFIVNDIKKGQVLNQDNLRSIRPGVGIHPKYYDSLMGKKVNQNLDKGTPLNLKHIQ